MSGKLVSQILLKNIPEGKWVLITLASHCHGESQTCWPSVELLAKECQITERQVYTLLSQLKELGYLSSQRAGPKPTVFTLHPEKMPDLTPEAHFRSDAATPEAHFNLDLKPTSITPEAHFSRNKEEPERTGKSNRKFVRPALAEIRSYCEARHNRVDPEKFFSFYEANGWKVGKVPMRDWKAAVRYWERNEVTKAPADLSERNQLALEKWKREHREEIA